MAGALLVVFSSSVSAQTLPDAAEILRKVGETYKDAKQYEIEADFTLENPETKQTSRSHLRFAFRAPDKYRAEAKGGLLNLDRQPGDPVIEELLTVYDGANLWVYNPKSNEYRVYVVPQLPRDSRPEDIDRLLGIGVYHRAAELWAAPTFLREESIAVGRETTDCLVVQASQVCRRP